MALLLPVLSPANIHLCPPNLPPFYKEAPVSSRCDGLVGSQGTCRESWWPEIELGIHVAERQTPSLKSVLWPLHVHHGMCMPTHMHAKQKNQCIKQVSSLNLFCPLNGPTPTPLLTEFPMVQRKDVHVILFIYLLVCVEPGLTYSSGCPMLEILLL